MAADPSPLTLAVPKGRVLKQLAPHLRALGFPEAAFDGSDRRLRFAAAGAEALELLLLKPDDVPTYVEYGAAQLGIVGRDILLERGYALYTPLDLGIGRCRLALAGLPDMRERIETIHALRIGTKFSNVTRRYFEQQGRRADTIYLQGSVELAPLTGLAHAIVDLVESGQTLRDNGLVEYTTLHEISAVVAVNPAAYKLERRRVRALLDALDTVPAD